MAGYSMSEDRAIRAIEDVVAVEDLGPGMARVTTWSDSYVVDMRDGGCNCPDKEFNDAPMCKHEASALLANSDDYPDPYIRESLDNRNGQSSVIA